MLPQLLSSTNILKPPRRLRLDEAAGLLSGTPDAAGKVEGLATATIERRVRKLNVDQSGWGPGEGSGQIPRESWEHCPAVRHRGRPIAALGAADSAGA